MKQVAFPNQAFLLAFIITLLELSFPAVAQRTNPPRRGGKPTPPSTSPSAMAVRLSILQLDPKVRVINLSEEMPVLSLLGVCEATHNASNVTCQVNTKHIELGYITNGVYKIILADHLDREHQPYIDVNITCTDNRKNPQFASAYFTINITDENDNHPVFSQSRYNASVEENVEPGAIVLQVKALDPDAGENSQVRYEIPEQFEDQVPFVIDAESGVISTTAMFDREAVSSYTFTVEAVDMGQPSLNGTAEVFVEVTDKNDNPPVIKTKTLRTRENQAAMSNVGVLLGSDLDVGKNAELFFMKVEGDATSSMAPFLVEPNGTVLSVVPLDREQRSKYQMTVMVRDKGSPRLNSTALVEILVEDVNDNPPIVSSECMFDDFGLTLDDNYMDDNSSDVSGHLKVDWLCPNKIIHKVTATDNDSGDNSKLNFALRSLDTGETRNQTQGDLFQIDKDTGAISFRRCVNNEDTKINIINVTVSDRGSPSHVTYCALNITLDVDMSKLQAVLKSQSTQSSLGARSSANVNTPLWSADLSGSRYLTLCVLTVLVCSLLNRW